MVIRRTRGVVMAGALALVLTAGACSSSDDGGSSSSSAPASSGGGGGTATLTVKDFAFDPVSLSVATGETTITVTNEGAVEHSFTLDDESVSQDIAPGASETVTVNVSADAGFHCKYHTSMVGTLTVG